MTLEEIKKRKKVTGRMEGTTHVELGIRKGIVNVGERQMARPQSTLNPAQLTLRSTSKRG